MTTDGIMLIQTSNPGLCHEPLHLNALVDASDSRDTKRNRHGSGSSDQSERRLDTDGAAHDHEGLPCRDSSEFQLKLIDETVRRDDANDSMWVLVVEHPHGDLAGCSLFDHRRKMQMVV